MTVQKFVSLEEEAASSALLLPAGLSFNACPHSLSSMSIRDRLIMLIAAVVKKFLWVLRYPSFDRPLVGDYAVGAIQTRIPGSVACQIHYPATPNAKKDNTSTPYFRPEAVAGLADYSRMPADLMSFLSHRRHPCRINAAAIPNQSFPLVIFSHGLGGSMELYTQLCQQISSCGYVVAALEHQDGSACYAEQEASKDNDDRATPLLYTRPDDSPYSRHKVTDFRKAFLQQRVEETTQVVDYMRSASTNTNVDAHTQSVLQAADTTQGISLVGHSFGGATMVLAAQEYLSQHKKYGHMQPSSVSLLDCWAFALPDTVLQQGIPSIPTLSILSEAWLTNPETAQVKHLLESSHQVTSLYAPGSVHASVSDSSTWLPGFLLRKFRLRGPQEARHVTIRAAAQACVAHMRQTAGGSDSTDEHAYPSLLEPFLIDKPKVSVDSVAVSSPM
jgi:platelet-activating factor acetylhydrolase